MSDDSEASASPANQDPGPVGEAADPPSGEGTQSAPADDPTDPAEDLKAKYREALAHKHGSQGAAHTEHGDKDAATPGHEQAHAPRMFRRKSG